MLHPCSALSTAVHTPFWLSCRGAVVVQPGGKPRGNLCRRGKPLQAGQTPAGQANFRLLCTATPLQGVVVQLEPMRTAIQDEDGIVYINNSEVSNYIIRNISQLQRLKEASGASAAGGASLAA